MSAAHHIVVETAEQDTDVLADLLTMLEKQLAVGYGLELLVPAHEFLLPPEWPTPLRAGVFVLTEAPTRTDNSAGVVQAPEAELSLGIHLASPLRQRLLEHDPRQGLGGHNLDAFWVVVEELSHFHLLTQRAHHGQQVSQLELELQGEIDKILLAAWILQQQTGWHHLPPLVQALFHTSQSIALPAERELYRLASHWAAGFWSATARRGQLPVRPWLRQFYRADLSEKLTLLRRGAERCVLKSS